VNLKKCLKGNQRERWRKRRRQRNEKRKCEENKCSGFGDYQGCFGEAYYQTLSGTHKPVKPTYRITVTRLYIVDWALLSSSIFSAGSQ
jgi:hypothetical protein